MRIISGKHKGRRLMAPKKLPVRPTTDQAKEGLFNILWNRYDFDDITVLDLFSGTGNMAYEFASRGVKNVTAVDQFFGCVRFIKKTAAELEMPISTVKSETSSFLAKTADTFDLIFADPPYNFTDDQFKEIVDLVFKHQHLNTNGVLIVEHSKHTKSLSELPSFVEQRAYGGSVFSFFEE